MASLKVVIRNRIIIWREMSSLSSSVLGRLPGCGNQGCVVSGHMFRRRLRYCLFARSGHQQKDDLTLVVRVSSTAEEVLLVGDDQVKAVEEKVVVQVPFLEAKGHLQRRILRLPKT